jgi:hypothetical protein
MNTKLFQSARYSQDGDGSETGAPAQAQGHHARPRNRLNRRANSIGGPAGGQTPPPHTGSRSAASGVAGYRSRLAGAPKGKIKNIDAVLDAMAAHLLDLDPILTAAFLLEDDDE